MKYHFNTETGEYSYIFEDEEPTEEDHPEIPPPVWDERRIDPDRAMAAVRAMCG